MRVGLEFTKFAIGVMVKRTELSRQRITYTNFLLLKRHGLMPCFTKLNTQQLLLTPMFILN